MLLKYLSGESNALFELEIEKNVNGYEYSSISINPLLRHLKTCEAKDELMYIIEEFIKFLISNVQLIERDNDLSDGKHVLTTVVADNDINRVDISFNENFLFEDSTKANLNDAHHILTEKLLSIIEKYSNQIKENIEEILTELLSFNYNDTCENDNYEEVGRVIIDIDNDDNVVLSFNTIDFDVANSIKYDLLIEDTLVRLASIIRSYIKTDNIALITEPTALIKLYVKDNSQYTIISNTALLKKLYSEDELAIIGILSHMFENLSY